MSTYILRNCPNLVWCEHCKDWECGLCLSGDDYKRRCQDNTAEQCILKKLIDNVSTEYHEPEYFSTITDKTEYECASAMHNMAHLVICTLNKQEIHDATTT